MIDVVKAALEQQDYLLALRREFHKNPELSLKEYRTAQRIEEELDSFGIEHRRVDNTGVLGILHGEGEGNGVLVLRADIDALPIQETNPVEYISQCDGVMHACGHDAHTACLLGAAKILAANKGEFGGEIRFVFQHAEEIGHGAKPFIREGVLEGAEKVFGLHTAPDILCGSVGLKSGLNNASVDHFKITVQGKSAHVSTPHQGIDALYIGCQIVTAVQALVTRCTSPVEPLIIGIGKMNAGTTYNALAETAVLEGTTRTISHETRAWVREAIDRIVKSTAENYGGTAEVVWTDFTSPLINYDSACKDWAKLVEKHWGAGKVVTDRALSLGGDDFAEFLLTVPGAYAYLGTGNPEKPSTLNPAHNGNFDLDEDALHFGAGLYVAVALEELGR